MAKKSKKKLDPSLPIFQLKITLENTEPPIWRQIQTHDCSLADLHEIIQSCMGWEGEHMHAFEIGDKPYTNLAMGGDRYEYGDSRALRLSKIVERGQNCFVYEYDFGDSWRHSIEIEKTLPIEEKVRYPQCMDGRRACPPEDCGGPYGYYELLNALANPGQDDDHDERLEWLGDDFDPEMFGVDDVNKVLLRLRRWIGQQKPRGQTARFAVGDRIRANPGVVHSEYPDIPLGGWVGTVAQIAWLIPISYEIHWTEETLAAAHPVYGKRCRRDEATPDLYWLDEGEMELDSAEQPAIMEQPANLVVKPLSEDDQEDRTRMVFGLTSDDPLPKTNDEAQRQYLDYLKTHLTFPINATDWTDFTENYSIESNKPCTIVGFASLSPIDLVEGVLCEVRCGQETKQLALIHLEVNEEDPNFQFVDDYRNWVWDVMTYDHLAGDEDEDEDEDENEEYWDDEDDFEEEDEFDEDEYDDFEFDEKGLLPLLAHDMNDVASVPEPIRRELPSVGRNDPCPCGSGIKFKKCCLKKPNDL